MSDNLIEFRATRTGSATAWRTHCRQPPASTVPITATFVCHCWDSETAVRPKLHFRCMKVWLVIAPAAVRIAHCLPSALPLAEAPRAIALCWRVAARAAGPLVLAALVVPVPAPALRAALARTADAQHDTQNESEAWAPCLSLADSIGHPCSRRAPAYPGSDTATKWVASVQQAGETLWADDGRCASDDRQ